MCVCVCCSMPVLLPQWAELVQGGWAVGVGGGGGGDREGKDWQGFG